MHFQLESTQMVDDMAKSLEFYTKTLTFVATSLVPDTQPFFAILTNGLVAIMLYARAQFANEIPGLREAKLGGAIALYLQVENITGLYQELTNKVTIIQPLHATDYGTKEFSFEDYNGYVWIAAEEPGHVAPK